MQETKSEINDLERLEHLRSSGTLTEDEFEIEKQKIIRPHSEQLNDEGIQNSVNKKSRSSWNVFFGIVGLFLILYGVSKFDSPSLSSQDDSSIGNPEFQKSHTFSALTIASDYEANEIAADRKYLNKSLWVNGVVEDIDRELLGRPYVMLRTGLPARRIQCVLNSEDDAANLSKGNYITLHGVCKGATLIDVLMEKCELAANY